MLERAKDVDELILELLEEALILQASFAGLGLAAGDRALL